MRHLILLASLLLLPVTSQATLNEFSAADGYGSPFWTRVWTYNSLWSFDGGNISNNYVAQHGYGAGFPFAEPFALVIRNDNTADNYQFSYAFEAFDLGGVNPNAPGTARIAITFDVCSVVHQNSSTDNGAAMLTFKFGGTRANPGVTIGFSDANKLMYSDAGGNLQIFAGYTLNGAGWDRITLTLDFGSGTYDLQVESMSGSSSLASNTYNPTALYLVTTAMPFTNAIADLATLFFETFTDPENGLGWGKTYIDNFQGRLDGVISVAPTSWGKVKANFQ